MSEAPKIVLPHGGFRNLIVYDKSLQCRINTIISVIFRIVKVVCKVTLVAACVFNNVRFCSFCIRRNGSKTKACQT